MRKSRLSDSQIMTVLNTYHKAWLIGQMSIKLPSGIQPGKPTQNAYIERFNRTVRHEWLDMHLFESIEHAQHLASDWLWKYNNERPNSAIGGVPPRQLLKAA